MGMHGGDPPQVCVAGAGACGWYVWQSQVCTMLVGSAVWMPWAFVSCCVLEWWVFGAGAQKRV